MMRLYFNNRRDRRNSYMHEAFSNDTLRRAKDKAYEKGRRGQGDYFYGALKRQVENQYHSTHTDGHTKYITYENIDRVSITIKTNGTIVYHGESYRLEELYSDCLTAFDTKTARIVSNWCKEFLDTNEVSEDEYAFLTDWHNFKPYFNESYNPRFRW